MRSLLDYRCSDLSQGSHRGDLVLDLEQIDLPDHSIDVLLTAHVLEHVPDLERALSEVRRILRPGGHALIQVPVLQGRTEPGSGTELHEDSAPVHWRFGPDFTAGLRAARFTAELLVTVDLAERARRGAFAWTETAPEFDVDAIARAVTGAKPTTVADAQLAAALGLEPSYMFLVWDAVKP
jgi:SAM-dependent methyltransferase